MATNNNELGLLFKINADPSQADAEIKDFQAKMDALAAKGIAVGQAFVDEQAASQAAWDAAYEAAGRQNAAIDETQQSVLQLANGMTALAEVSRQSLDAEPVIVYGAAAQQAAGQVVGAAEEAAVANRTIQATAQAANATQGESIGIIEGLRGQYAALASEVESLEALPFLSGEEAAGLATDRDMMAEIETEAQALGATLSEDGSVGGGMMSSLASMRAFRYSFAATVGLVSFGFWVTEWAKVVGYIQEASLAMGGFSIAAQKAFTDAGKAYDTYFGRKPLYVEAQLKAAQEKVNDLQKQVSAAKAAYDSALAAQNEGALSTASNVQDLKKQWLDLKDAETQASAEEEKWLLVRAQQTKPHHDATRAVNAQVDALGNLLLAEKDQVEQLGVGDSARRRAIASYDAEIRKINATVDALKRHHQYTGVEAAKADEARVLAATIRDRQLEQVDNAERERRDKSFAALQEHQSKHLDLILGHNAKLRQRYQQEAMATAAKGIPTGAHGAPELPVGIQAQAAASQAATEAASRIDLETRSVWNLQAALLGLGPVIDQVAQKHQFATQMEDRFSEAMGKNIAAAIVYGNSIGAAVEKALKASIASIAAEAMVRAIFSTAFGFLMLAEHDYPAAAQAFEAAAVFGAVGGAAAAVAHAIPGGTSGHGRAGSHGAAGAGAGRGSAGAPGRAMASPTAAGARGPQYPGGSLTVAIMGNEEAGQWLATTLNSAVETNGVRLVSSHTKTSAPVGQ